MKKIDIMYYNSVSQLTEKKAEIVQTPKKGTTSDTGSLAISGYPGTLINVLPSTTDLVANVYIDDNSKIECAQFRDKNGNIYKNSLVGCVIISMRI